MPATTDKHSMSRPRPPAGDKDKGDKDKDDKERVHFNFDVPGLLHSSTNLENLQNFENLQKSFEDLNFDQHCYLPHLPQLPHHPHLR